MQVDVSCKDEKENDEHLKLKIPQFPRPALLPSWYWPDQPPQRGEYTGPSQTYWGAHWPGLRDKNAEALT
jgi:hypothetical protein